MKKAISILKSTLLLVAILVAVTSCSQNDEPDMPYITPTENESMVNDPQAYQDPADDPNGAPQSIDDTSTSIDSPAPLMGVD